MKGYLSIREAAEKWGVSERRVQQYCLNGRIPGAERFANAWVIPDTATKPTDPRKDWPMKNFTAAIWTGTKKAWTSWWGGMNPVLSYT